MKTVLALDCNYLLYRAHFSMPQLFHNEIPTGAVYGFFRGLPELQDRFNARRIAFCFDHGRVNIREGIFPAYKYKRRNKVHSDPLDAAQFTNLREQLRALKLEYLPEVGYRNIFYASGYEADDCIASVIQGLGPAWDAVIVSADHDLYQLLGDGVCIYHPQQKKVITAKSFTEQYGITPQQWVEVKAMAGCSTDEIPGIPGVGEKTAVKFLCGDLKSTSLAACKIAAGFNAGTVTFNQQLVRLPYPGTPSFRVRSDHVDQRAWKMLMGRLGMESLMESARG